MTEKSTLGKNQLLISFLSGAGAGVACTLLCAPLDVAKVRLQIQGSLNLSKYGGGIIPIIRTIYAEEGLSGVFRGVGPALLTIPLFWSVYWPMYDRIKVQLQEMYPNTNPSGIHLTAAVSSGVITDIITNPFWVTRTRIQTLIMHPEMKVRNMSTFSMMKTIYQQEGFFALYKGLGASFLGLSHVAIQFPLCKNFIYYYYYYYYYFINNIFFYILFLDEHLKAQARIRRNGEESVNYSIIIEF
jgi:solute carrier family 25 (mitochondrial folate transporter), member 32